MQQDGRQAVLLQGELVRLRAYSREDLPKARAMINDPEVRQFLMPGIPWPLRPEDEEKWYETLDPFGTGPYSLAIERLSDGEYLGGCGVNHVDWKNSKAEVGIFLGKQYWGFGYGTDALRVLVSFVFDEMNMHKVYLRVYSFNERAIQVYKSLGFKVDGVLRDNVFRDGQYHDELEMSVLRNEWRQLQSK
ncbi:GNAT family N-acetyltransferase [Coprothermobacteraceae bacterium]|nr:GNAT family N-acetyltransferase [Coprothermobacteraceae bacterium]